MGRKKRRSSKFKDSSTVIDMEQARKERQEKRKKAEARRQKPKSRPETLGRAPEPGSPEAARRQAERNEVRARMAEATGQADARSFQTEEAEADWQRGSEYAAETSGEYTEARGAEDENSMASEAYSGRHDRRKMALRRRKRNRNLIFAGVFLILLILVGFSVGNIIVLKHDLHTAQKEQEQYIEEKAQLQEDLKEIDDLQNLEEQARDQMRLIKPGETLYIFPEDMTQQ